VTEPSWSTHAELAGHYTTREEWLALRRTGIGSSDCSAVLGLGKYGSPFSVWVEKTGRAAPVEETEAMMWGTLLEPVIRTELARRLDVEVVTSPTLRSLARPWQLYNADGLIPSLNAVVEIKNASAWLAHDWDEQIPDHAELQVQHGMAVTGADGAYVAGLIGGNRLRWEYIPRDDRLIDTVNAAEQHLWDTYIVADVAPPIDGSDATAEAIAARWPRRFDVTEVAEDIPAVLESVEAYHTAHASVKLAESQKAQAVNQLSFLLRGADVLTDAAGRKLVALKRGQFREKAFREEFDGAPEWLHKVEIVDRDRLKVEDPELFRRFQAASVYIPKGK
jgi:putative phage-type endonuclease